MRVYEEGDRVVNAWFSGHRTSLHGTEPVYRVAVLRAVRNPYGAGLVWQGVSGGSSKHGSSARRSAKRSGLPFEPDAYPDRHIPTKEEVLLEILQNTGM